MEAERNQPGRNEPTRRQRVCQARSVPASEHWQWADPREAPIPSPVPREGLRQGYRELLHPILPPQTWLEQMTTPEPSLCLLP